MERNVLLDAVKMQRPVICIFERKLQPLSSKRLSCIAWEFVLQKLLRWHRLYFKPLNSLNIDGAFLILTQLKDLLLHQEAFSLWHLSKVKLKTLIMIPAGQWLWSLGRCCGCGGWVVSCWFLADRSWVWFKLLPNFFSRGTANLKLFGVSSLRKRNRKEENI